MGKQRRHLQHGCSMLSVAPTIRPNDTQHVQLVSVCLLHSMDNVPAYIPASTADRQHEQHILSVELEHAQPLLEHELPAIVVGSGSQLSYIVRGCAGFNRTQLAKVIDRMRSVG